MTPLEIAGAIGVISGALTGLVGAGAALLRVERRGRQLANGLLGDEHHPGMLRRMDQLDQEVARINAQVHPNSGTSLRDAVDRIERDLAAHQTMPASVAHG